MDKIRKIVFLTSSLNAGGAERVISELSNSFSALGIEVVILLVSRDIVKYKVSNDVTIVPICRSIKGNGIRGAINRIYRLRKVVKQINPDIIISFLTTINIYSCIAFGFSRYKLIVSERNDPKRDPKSKFKRFVRNIVYHFSDGLVCQTTEIKEYFSSALQRKAIIIPNPVKQGLPNLFQGVRKKEIIAVGRLEKQKNYNLLIDAFSDFIKEYKEYRLIIYGDGSLKGELQKKVNDLNLTNKIVFKGVVENFHHKIVDATMYILTSDYEGMPNSLMEALAIGLPSISTDCSGGGPRYLIKNGENGLLIPIGDKSSLLKNMKRIADDPEFAKRLSINAVRTSKNFRIEEITKFWLRYIDRIVNG